VTKLDANNKPIYDRDQMCEIVQGDFDSLSEEEINAYSKLDENGKPIYDNHVMCHIRIAYRDGLSQEMINEFLKTHNGEFIYNIPQMSAIRNAFRDGLTFEDVKTFTILDKNMKPVYESSHMYAIINGYTHGLSKEKIEIFSQLKNDKPKFNAFQVTPLEHFIEKADEQQVALIKECIDDNIKYEKFSMFMRHDIPVKNMRIYKSFCLEDIKKEYVDEIISANKCRYHELKEIKYLLQCTKELFPKKNYPNMSLNYILKDDEEQEINSLNATQNLLKYTYEFRLYDKKCIDIVDKCLSYKLPPEQIVYLTNPEFAFTYKEMKDVAIGLLNGLTPDEIEAVSGSELKGRTLAEAIDDAVKDKFFDLNNIEKEISIKTDWFEGVER
jgi:hypothetical protein